MPDRQKPSRPQAPVGVVIVNYNTGHLLPRCLAALQAQVSPPRRVVVVDNASQDDSRRILGGLGQAVEVLWLKENLGFAAANNLGMAMLDDCAWVALVNPDAFPAPRWLAEMMAAAQRHAGFAFLASRLVQDQQPHLLDGAGDQYHVSGLARRRLHCQPLSRDLQEVREVFGPCAAAALYQRRALLEVGGFDESYFWLIRFLRTLGLERKWTIRISSLMSLGLVKEEHRHVHELVVPRVWHSGLRVCPHPV